MVQHVVFLLILGLPVEPLPCSGGTLSGIARCLKRKNPRLVVVGVDPHGSIMHDDDAPRGSYLVEGIGYDFVPKVLDRCCASCAVASHHLSFLCWSWGSFFFSLFWG